MRCFAMALSIAFAPAAVIAACSTSGRALEAPLTEGQSHNFPASYDVVKAAALASVGQLNVSVEGADETPERYQIRFMKVLGGVAWGNMGVVNVVRVDDWTTQVVVNSEAHSVTVRTDARSQQFADRVFSNIAETLARQRNDAAVSPPNDANVSSGDDAAVSSRDDASVSFPQ